MSKYANLENEYNTLTNEFMSINNHFNNENGTKNDNIAKENSSLMSILDKMNLLVNKIVEETNTKLLKNPPKQEKIIIDNSSQLKENNYKLLEIYKSEYSQLEKQYNKSSNTDYYNKLEEELKYNNKEIFETETSIRKLKLLEKQTNSNLDRKIKSLEENTITKYKQDHDTLIKLTININEKIDKNAIILQELKEKQEAKESKLVELSKRTTLENYEVYDIEKNEKLKEKKEQILKKKIILDKKLESTQKKYNSEVNKNKVTIKKLREEANMLTKIIFGNKQTLEEKKDHIRNTNDFNSTKEFSDIVFTNDISIKQKANTGRIQLKPIQYNLQDLKLEENNEELINQNLNGLDEEIKENLIETKIRRHNLEDLEEVIIS